MSALNTLGQIKVADYKPHVSWHMLATAEVSKQVREGGLCQSASRKGARVSRPGPCCEEACVMAVRVDQPDCAG